LIGWVIAGIVWCWAATLAFWSALKAYRMYQRTPRVLQRPLDPATQSAVVILPIKGVEADTEANLRALWQQDYRHLRLIFCIEANDDPAKALIERLALEYPSLPAEIIVSGRTMARGQKIHNQLAGVLATDERDTILVFMDADAHPGPNWVQALIAPLEYLHRISLVSGYRYYVPQDAHPANAVVCVLNAGVAALLGPYRHNFAWGGSMAIRREDFFSFGIYAAWQNALSDDYVMSHVMRRHKNAKIHFVPQCLVASKAQFDWSGLFEFGTRQYRITRIGAPLIWICAVLGALFYFYGMIAPLPGIIYGLLNQDWFLLLTGGAELILFGGLVWLRGYYLILAGQRILPQHATAIGQARTWATWLHPLVYTVNAWMLLRSACGAIIAWRGVRYRMRDIYRTDVVAREAP